jgi:pSer/pThr/pTyr-binding forkhead associated (FHA) protein
MRADDRRREPTVRIAEDLGSLDGTWINGWRVGRAVVRPGDTLHIADVRVVLSHG